MRSGITLEEMKRLFNYLEKNKTNDNLQIIMTTESCHDLYKLFINFTKYQKILEDRIDKATKYINKGYYEMNLNPVKFSTKLLKILRGE